MSTTQSKAVSDRADLIRAALDKFLKARIAFYEARHDMMVAEDDLKHEVFKAGLMPALEVNSRIVDKMLSAFQRSSSEWMAEDYRI